MSDPRHRRSALTNASLAALTADAPRSPPPSPLAWLAMVACLVLLIALTLGGVALTVYALIGVVAGSFLGVKALAGLITRRGRYTGPSHAR